MYMHLKLTKRTKNYLLYEINQLTRASEEKLTKNIFDDATAALGPSSAIPYYWLTTFD